MEPFRDDEQALRARVLELERELEGLREQIDRAASGRDAVSLPGTLAKMLEVEKHALAEVRLELSRVRMNPRRGEPNARPGIALVAFIVMGLILVALLSERSEP